MKNTKQICLTLGLLVLITMNACHHQKNNGTSTNNENKTDSKLMQEWSALEDSTQSTFDTFKSKLSAFEKAAAKTNKRIGVEKQQAIINMIAKQDSIETDLKRSKKMTEKDWDKFKTELRQELDRFNKNMNEFFKDTVSTSS